MKGQQFDCPVCGWSVTTPHGMDDLKKTVMMHKDDHHPDMKLSEKEAMGMVKEVDMMGGKMSEMKEGEMMKGGSGKITQKEESEAWRAQENIGKRM